MSTSADDQRAGSTARTSARVSVNGIALTDLLRHVPGSKSAIGRFVYCGCCGELWPCWDYRYAKDRLEKADA